MSPCMGPSLSQTAVPGLCYLSGHKPEKKHPKVLPYINYRTNTK